MKNKLVMMMCCLLMIISAGCSSDDDSSAVSDDSSDCYVILFCNKGEEKATAVVYSKPQGINEPSVNDYLIFPVGNINLNNVKTDDLLMIKIKSYIYNGPYQSFNSRYFCEVEPCK